MSIWVPAHLRGDYYRALQKMKDDIEKKAQDDKMLGCYIDSQVVLKIQGREEVIPEQIGWFYWLDRNGRIIGPADDYREYPSRLKLVTQWPKQVNAEWLREHSVVIMTGHESWERRQ